VENPKAKEIFQRLADEEEEHHKELSNLIRTLEKNISSPKIQKFSLTFSFNGRVFLSSGFDNLIFKALKLASRTGLPEVFTEIDRLPGFG
jgi:rubrerythrin